MSIGHTMVQNITLQILDNILQNAQKIQKLTGYSLNDILAEKLFSHNWIPAQIIQQQLDNLHQLSDIQLLWFIYLRLPTYQLTRIDKLTEQAQTQDNLTEDERSELDRLLERNEIYQLLRSEAPTRNIDALVGKTIQICA